MRKSEVPNGLLISLVCKADIGIMPWMQNFGIRPTEIT